MNFPGLARVKVYDARAVTALAVILLCLLLFSDPHGLAAYQRQAVLDGEYWRAVSSHFTHLTVMHLALNIAAWLLVFIYGWFVCSALMWCVLIGFCTLATGAAMFFVLSDVQTYTGFSAVLHGLLVAVALLRIRADKSDFTAWSLLFLIAVKLVYEFLHGPTPMTQSIVGVAILTESHLYGALSGLLAAVLVLIGGTLARVLHRAA